MKYCYTCRAFRQSSASYCLSCGRSFDVRLCERQHLNPRSADYCQECGSTELSTPDRRPPMRAILSGLGVVSAMGVAVFALGWMLASIVLDFFPVYRRMLGSTIIVIGVGTGITVLRFAAKRTDREGPPVPPPPTPPRQEEVA